MEKLPRDTFAVLAHYWPISSISTLRCASKYFLFILNEDFLRGIIYCRFKNHNASQLWVLHWPGKARILFEEFILVFSEILGLSLLAAEQSSDYTILKSFFRNPFYDLVWVDVDSLALFLKWCFPLPLATQKVQDLLSTACFCGVLGHSESVIFFQRAQVSSGMIVRLSPETGGFIVTYRTREPGSIILHKIVSFDGKYYHIGPHVADTLEKVIVKMRKDLGTIEFLTNDYRIFRGIK